MTNELYEKLAHLQWLLHKQRMHGWAVHGPLVDPTRGQGRILAVLKLRDGISTKDLSYLLGVRVSSLNELLAKLEKNGYVTREPSAEDKRVMLVKLTEKGQNERQPEAFAYDDIFSCLTEEEQQILGAYLDRLIDALHAEIGEDGEEMLEKMSALRERFGDMDDFWDKYGREFRSMRDFPGNRRAGHGPGHAGPGHVGPEHFGPEDFPGQHGWHGPGRDEDEE